MYTTIERAVNAVKNGFFKFGLQYYYCYWFKTLNETFTADIEPVILGKALWVIDYINCFTIMCL